MVMVSLLSFHWTVVHSLYSIADNVKLELDEAKPRVFKHRQSGNRFIPGFCEHWTPHVKIYTSQLFQVLLIRKFVFDWLNFVLQSHLNFRWNMANFSFAILLLVLAGTSLILAQNPYCSIKTCYMTPGTENTLCKYTVRYTKIYFDSPWTKTKFWYIKEYYVGNGLPTGLCD